MINGLSKWTTNAGAAINYFLGDEHYDKEAKEWKARDPEPVILEGDPKAMKFICDKLDFKNKYTTGVLSFNLEETARIAANPELKDQILQDFKDFAFAGVPDNARQFLAIEHSHTGRLEIHYMMPRVHLESGKYRNPFPPNYNGLKGKGHNKDFIYENDSYTDHACIKFGLKNPKDLDIARDLKIEKFDPEASTKRDVHKFVNKLVVSGHITCREDVEDYLKRAGGTITRSGEDYLSVKFADNQKAMRFKGEFYGKHTFGEAALSAKEFDSGQKSSEESIKQRFSEVMEYRTQETLRRHSPKESNNKEFDGDEPELDESELELESEFSELLAAHEEFENSTDDLSDVKSAAADFASSNSQQVADYSEKSAEITSGVDTGDITTLQTDDPVIRFFQDEFKKQLQKEVKRAAAASKKLWNTPFASPKSDELFAERVGIIFKTAFGAATGINIDRPGRAFDRKALAEATAKASGIEKEHAVVVEEDRQKHINAAVAEAQAARIHEQEDADERTRREQERRMPSWKRNGHDLDDQNNGPRPGGR